MATSADSQPVGAVPAQPPAGSTDKTDGAGGPEAQPPSPGVPPSLRSAAGWTWRLLVVGVGVYLVLQLLARLAVVTSAVVAALLLAALLAPVARLLGRCRVPTSLAAAVTLLALLGVIALAGLLVWRQAVAQFQ